jgi:hypothetical protein
MSYELSGEFIEACDCYLMCPCWIGDAPDEGHCTGLFAWVMAPGSHIDTVDVSGMQVVSVSTHTGTRRGGSTITVVFVDSRADVDQFGVLAAAFSGQLEGPLGELAAVSGAVMKQAKADISIDLATEAFIIRVTGVGDEAGIELAKATGSPKRFQGESNPLTMQHTALSLELGVPAGDEDVIAQQGNQLAVRVPLLPGGYMEVTGRSAMRGQFGYQFAERRARKRTLVGAEEN